MLLVTTMVNPRTHWGSWALQIMQDSLATQISNIDSNTGNFQPCPMGRTWDIPFKSHGSQCYRWEVCMFHDKGGSSWDKPKWDASNMRICFISQLSLSIKGTILTFQEWEYNFLNRDGPSTLDSISGGLGFLLKWQWITYHYELHKSPKKWLQL
jgi:hypothetical protein